jgi:phosphate uptake regulator
MKRKVNLAGPTTLTVSLPSKWAKQHNIKKGDEIDVDEDGSALVISKERVQKEKVGEVYFSEDTKRYVRSYIGRFYRHGYTTIRVSFDSPVLVKAIKDATNNLIGADIIDLEKSTCIIKIFPIEETNNIDKYLAKMFNTIKYLLTLMEEDLNRGEFKREETVNELRHNNWKLKDYILRNAFMQRVPYEKFGTLSNMLFCYEKIGTKLLGFYRMLVECEKKKKLDPKVTSQAFKRIQHFVDWFMDAVSKDSPITPSQEAGIRKEIMDFQKGIFKDAASGMKAEKIFVTMAYFTSEMLDGTVSYLEAYKSKEAEN